MWLAEFGRVIYPAATLTPAARLRGIPAVEMAPLLDGHADALFHAFPDGITIHDPIDGLVAGEDAVRAYVARGLEWVEAKAARSELLALTLGRNRAVGEFTVELAHDGHDGSVLIAVVAEPGSDRRDLVVRLYHSIHAVGGDPRTRGRLLPADPSATPSDAAGKLFAALASGNVPQAVSAFDASGCLREAEIASGRHCGAAELKAWFTTQLADGGLGIEIGSVTDDGVRAIIEYTVTARHGAAVAPEAAIAACERGAMGPMAEVRFYQD